LTNFHILFFPHSLFLFLSVWFLGFLFGRSFQISSPFLDILSDMDCPEYHILTEMTARITERQNCILSVVEADLSLTRESFWRFLRFKVQNSKFRVLFFTEKLCAVDNCEISSFGVHKTATHFQLKEERETIVDLLFLDQLMLNTSKTDFSVRFGN
jgi:hypothetical protein